MRRTMVLVVGGLLLMLGSRGDVTQAGGPGEDDLAVVRRAVAQDAPTAAAPSPPEERAPARKSPPQWLRVRITERGKSKVSVNLPLALARSLGDDLPIHWGCRRHGDETERRTIRLGDVLKSLDSGQDIVQVDSEDGTVRVWVE
jgi:hypothetical protein